MKVRYKLQELVFMFKFFLIFLLLPIYIFSYTPGKWSHLDSYIFKGKPGGPDREIVKDANGKIIYSAIYHYNTNGFIISEEYFNDKKNSDGKTIFEYEKNRIVKEILYDAENVLKEKKVFKYNGNKLEKINLYNAKQELVLVCTINEFNYNMVTNAETKWTESEDTEKFTITQNEKDHSILNQNIYNNLNIKVGEVKMFYNNKGQLFKRENIQQEHHRLNQMNYDSSGNLISYTFHVKQGDKWILSKTHLLEYGQRTKTLIN